MMTPPRHPCRDCEERHTACAGSCARWQAYEAERAAYYRQKALQRAACQMPDEQQERIIRLQRRNVRNPKRLHD